MTMEKTIKTIVLLALMDTEKICMGFTIFFICRQAKKETALFTIKRVLQSGEVAETTTLTIFIASIFLIFELSVFALLIYLIKKITEKKPETQLLLAGKKIVNMREENND